MSEENLTSFFLKNAQPTESLMKELEFATDKILHTENDDFNLSTNLLNNGVFGLTSFSKLFRNTIMNNLNIKEKDSFIIALKDEYQDINSIKKGTLICTFENYPEIIISLDFNEHQLLNFTKIKNEINLSYINLETAEEYFLEYKNYSNLESIKI